MISTQPKPSSSKLRKRRKRSNPYIAKDVRYVDYKNVELLQKFINNHGKIIPAAVSGLSAQQQRAMATAIKRARQIALLPYSVERVRR